MEVKYTNIKSKSGTVNVGKVTLISGENKSGKTAIVAAMQACLNGKIDGVGASNSRIGEIVAKDAFAASASVCDNDLSATCTVTLGKSVSVDRMVIVNGVHADKKVFAEDQFGGVPQSVPELLSMTGEELWGLMIPKGVASDVPSEITTAVDSLTKVRRDITNPIQTALLSGDIGVATTSGLAAAKSAVSSIKQEIKDLEVRMKVDIPEYTGPAIAEVRKRLGGLNARLDSHKTAFSRKKQNLESIEKLKVDAERLRISDANKATIEKSMTDKLAAISSGIRVIQDIINTDGGSPIIQAWHRATENITELMAASTGTSSFFIISDAVSSIGEEVDRLITLGGVSKRKALVSKVVVQLQTVLPSLNEAAYLERPESCLAAFEAMLETTTNMLGHVKTDRRQLAIDIEEMDKLIASVELKQFDLLSDEQVSSILGETAEMQAHFNVFQNIESMKSQLTTMQEQVIDLQEQKVSCEKLVEAFHVWRKEVIDKSLEQITAKADKFLAAMGSAPIQLELSLGKRTSVSIMDSSRKNIMVMSGAERLIYGVALLVSLQSFHSVKLPIIYVEGAELDLKSLELFLETAAAQRDRGYFVVAHYLRASKSKSFVEVRA